MAVVAYSRLLHGTLLQDGLDNIILVAGAELVLELALGCAIVCSLCALAVCSGRRRWSAKAPSNLRVGREF